MCGSEGVCSLSLELANNGLAVCSAWVLAADLTIDFGNHLAHPLSHPVQQPPCPLPASVTQVIVMSDSVSMLDDEAVPQAQREVLMRLHIRKMKAALAADLAAAAAAQEGAQGIAAGAGGSRQGGRLESGSGSGSGSGQQQGGAVSVSPGVRPLVTHPVTRHVAPPVAAGFGAPRHLARQVSGSGRARAQPTIPGRGDAEDVQLGMQGVQLRDR